MSGLWDLYQQQQINANRRTAGEAKSKAMSVKETIRLLELRIDKMNLVCQGLWSLVQEKTGLTEEVLLQRVQELDLKDGRLDGKMARTVSECTQCGRIIAKRRHRCLYCGSEKLKQSAFDGV